MRSFYCKISEYICFHTCNDERISIVITPNRIPNFVKMIENHDSYHISVYLSMNETNQQFLDSRLFGTKTTSNLATKNAKNPLVVRTEEETFAKDGNLYRKPTDSIYTRRNEIPKNQPETTNIGTWITVIGFIPGRIQEIVEYFTQFGTILRVDDTPGNWLYLEYQSNEMAQKALESFSESPQLITNSMAVACIPGRIASTYVPDNAAHSEFNLNPFDERVIIPEEKKSVVGTIFDSLFG